jgi:hypothetical protein
MKSIITTELDIFIAKTGASHTWFKSTAIDELKATIRNATANTSVIIMMGVNDCASSTTDPATRASAYVDDVNKLINEYPHIKFYFCSVNPVDGDYPSKYYSGGKIPKAALNASIEKFNKTIKSKCKAIYIDCHTYLQTCGFSTSDGIHYTADTTKNIYKYITNSGMNADTGNKIGMLATRQTAPTAEEPYWVSTDLHTEEIMVEVVKGENPYPAMEDNGFVLPSSAAYAWGRFSEIQRLPANLPKLSPEEWFDSDHGYLTSNEPEVGAVICWVSGIDSQESDGKGHVAIVEQIIDENTIVISESIDKNNISFGEIFRTAEIKNDNKNWGKDSSYSFKGFILNPGAVAGTFTDTITKSDINKPSGKWLTDNADRAPNARYICKYLLNCGWTLNAVAGFLGNVVHESSMNPDITEFGTTNGGYGLVQWTPQTRFTYWCDSQDPPLPHDDIDSQLARINHETGMDKEMGHAWRCTAKHLRDRCGCPSSGGVYWLSTKDDYGIPYTRTYPPATFKEFAESTLSPSELAWAFLYNYERPSGIIWGCRGRNGKAEGRLLTQEERDATRAAIRKDRAVDAEYWYSFLLDYCDGIGTKFAVDNLVVNNIMATCAKASFMAYNCESYSYTLTKASGESKTSKNYSINENTNITTFELSNLVPNTAYTLQVTVVGKEKGSKSSLEPINFTTLQDYPGSVGSIKLFTEDRVLPDKSFNIHVEAPTRFGYWKDIAENDYGYTISLIVDGRVLKEIDHAVFSTNSFIPINSKLFGKNSINIGANLQVGIRTWVRDNNDKKVYDSDYYTTSNSVCLLLNQITPYLKIV